MEASENTNFPKQVVPIMVSQLMPCIDVLNEYFGLGARYFDSTIQFQYDMNYSKGNLIPEEDDWEVYIPYYVEFGKVYKLLENAGLSRDKNNEKGIMDILAILANLIYDKEYEKIRQAIREAPGDEAMQYEDVRKDLLCLYMFINDPSTFLDREIAIQHATGKVKIENCYGWFTRRMLKEYLDMYLPDITSVEQAKEELDTYKKPAGRKSADEREQILIYGIYRIFHEQTEMKDDLPDRLCEFIFEYLKLIKVYDTEETLDMSNMRPTIRYIVKKPVQPKFGLGYELKEIDKSELSKLLNRLY